jgi:hypothetical protein
MLSVPHPQHQLVMQVTPQTMIQLEEIIPVEKELLVTVLFSYTVEKKDAKVLQDLELMDPF